VNFAEAVAILVARVFAPSVADRLVPIAPGRQAGVDVVLVGVDASALGDGRLETGWIVFCCTLASMRMTT